VQPVGADERFAAWMHEATGLDDVRLGAVIAGGNSNVTRLIETRQGRLVLRHPPVNVVSDKAAAGIEREYTVIKALGARAPVPRAVVWCGDRSILGQPFAVTGWIEGVALGTELPANYPQGPETIDRLGLEMMRGLATVHSVDWRDVLPADFGRPETFVQRQVERWLAVREQSRVRDLPLLVEVADWLLANRPAVSHASIIHCDFHLDNCLMALDGPRLKAILDWEMATIGDPLIDLGLCLFFWRRDPDVNPGFPNVQGLSNRADVMPIERLAEAWSTATGLDHDRLDYYMVFAAWRLAAIVEGAYVLHCQGKADTAYARGLEHDVPNLLREAAAIIDRGRA
jgi:aminoglycoside phosphotransferase (APT) family kinase protein